MGKAPLQWVWVLVSLALEQRKDKKPKRGGELSWERHREILCGKGTMGLGEGMTEPHPCVHPSPAFELLPDPGPSPGALLLPLLPWDCSGAAPSMDVLTQGHEGSRALGTDLTSLPLCRDTGMCPHPARPLEWSSSPTTSAEQNPKDVPPFPVLLTPHQTLLQQMSSPWRDLQWPPCKASWARTKARGISWHTLVPVSSHICFQWASQAHCLVCELLYILLMAILILFHYSILNNKLFIFPCTFCECSKHLQALTVYLC